MTSLISRNPTDLENWLEDANAGNKYEVIRTYYDSPDQIASVDNAFTAGQKNLRMRIRKRYRNRF